jgi:hypothetical protein
MTMRIGDIMIRRDGGTITFTVEDSELAGKYQLRTPFAGEPRPLFRDHRQLALGGPEEMALLASLRDWLSAAATEDSQRALARLDGMREWRNLPEDLDRVIPLHRIKSVIKCLEARTA